MGGGSQAACARTWMWAVFLRHESDAISSLPFIPATDFVREHPSDVMPSLYSPLAPKPDLLPASPWLKSAPSRPVPSSAKTLFLC